MWRISAFADEIDPALDRQLATLALEAINHLDLRGVWGKNVLALTGDELSRLRSDLAKAGVRVATIGSPIGKVSLDAPFTDHLDDFNHALDVAATLNAPDVRIFSFFIPAGDDPANHREEIIERLGRLTRVAEQRGITLVHENEKGIYGDTPDRCLDLLSAIDSPALRAVWDPANFVQCGVRPFTDGYARLRPYIAAVHVKDARAGSGEVVLPGAGDGQLREMIAALHDSGFDGVWSLEPHLQMAGPSSGFSGPDLFRQASSTFKALLLEQGIAWI